MATGLGNLNYSQTVDTFYTNTGVINIISYQTPADKISEVHLKYFAGFGGILNTGSFNVTNSAGTIIQSLTTGFGSAFTTTDKELVFLLPAGCRITIATSGINPTVTAWYVVLEYIK